MFGGILDFVGVELAAGDAFVCSGVMILVTLVTERYEVRWVVAGLIPSPELGAGYDVVAFRGGGCFAYSACSGLDQVTEFAGDTAEVFLSALLRGFVLAAFVVLREPQIHPATPLGHWHLVWGPLHSPHVPLRQDAAGFRPMARSRYQRAF